MGNGEEGACRFLSVSTNSFAFPPGKQEACLTGSFSKFV
jgi:hypothetical protein